MLAAFISETSPHPPQMRNWALWRFVRLRAADESVEAVDAVDQALLHQELQRAVDGGRLRRAGPVAEGRQQVVGLDRAVAAPDQLQHPAAQRGEPGAAPAAQVFGAGERVLDAALMLVPALVEGQPVARQRVHPLPVLAPGGGIAHRPHDVIV